MSDELRGHCFHAAIDAASDTGDITLRAAVPGKRIAVIHYLVSVDAAADIKLTWKSNTTAIAAMLFPSGAAGERDHDPGALFMTAVNEPLVLSRSVATAVGGYLRYKLID